MIAKFKNAFYKSKNLVHFNNAGVSPMSIPAAEAVKYWTERFAHEGFHAIPEAMEKSEIVRALVADVLGATPEEVAYFQSTAGAVSQVALGLGLKANDEVLIFDQEYPSNFYPWREACARAGAKLIIVPSGKDFAVSLDALFERVTARTRAIAFSWVQYRTGAMLDIRAITDFAKTRGIFTCCDIIQGAGLLPFNFSESGLDAACGGSHKWFVSGPSVGFLILKTEYFERFEPVLLGAMTFGGPDDFSNLESKAKTGPARFEPGSRNPLDLFAFAASLSLIKEVGVSTIAQEAEWLAKRLMHGLRERGYVIHSPHGSVIHSRQGSHQRGSVITFSSGENAKFKDVETLAAHLLGNGVSFAKRPPGIRFSPHAFNTQDEIDKVLGLL